MNSNGVLSAYALRLSISDEWLATVPGATVPTSRPTLDECGPPWRRWREEEVMVYQQGMCNN